MILEISIAVAAAAFVILVIYLVITLSAIQKTLRNVDQTLLKTDRLLEPAGEEVLKLLKTSSQIADFTFKKVENLDPLFHSISNVGECVNQATETLKSNFKPKQKPLLIEESDELSSYKLADWLEWAALGVVLWQKFKQRSKQ